MHSNEIKKKFTDNNLVPFMVRHYQRAKFIIWAESIKTPLYRINRSAVWVINKDDFVVAKLKFDHNQSDIISVNLENFISMRNIRLNEVPAIEYLI